MNCILVVKYFVVKRLRSYLNKVNVKMESGREREVERDVSGSEDKERVAVERDVSGSEDEERVAVVCGRWGGAR